MNVSALPFDEAIATAATGDIWLFRGRSLADRAIQTVTNSPVNHVGMVVALDDMPPLLWHAELGTSLPGRVDGRAPPRRAAAQARRRRPHLGREVRPARVDAAARGRDAHARARGPADRDDRQVRRQAVPDHAGLMRSWATGRVRQREVSRETIYCAELVAVTMQNMGLLPDKRPMSWYDPGKFWSGDDVVLVRAVRARRRDRGDEHDRLDR